MLATAFILGLISSLHCVGMCGPLSWFAVGQPTTERERISRLITYLLGKTITYVLMGLLFGLIGKSIGVGKWQQQMAVSVGILMLLYVLLSEKRFVALFGAALSMKGFQQLRARVLPYFSKHPFIKAFSVGLLNGFLPCGMIYMALFGALATGNVLNSMAYMLLFGLGTMPLMSATTLLLSSASLLMRRATSLIPIFIAVLGVWFILKGLGFGIPYLSPSNLELLVMQQPNCR